MVVEMVPSPRSSSEFFLRFLRFPRDINSLCDNMQSKEILDAIEAFQCASAKRHVLNDMCDYLKKYVRKLDNQLKDVTRKYDKISQQNGNDMEFYRIATRREQLQCQMIEALQLQQDFLQRSIKAGDEVIEAHDQLEEVRSRRTAESPAEQASDTSVSAS